MIRRGLGALGLLIAGYLIAGTLGGLIRTGTPPEGGGPTVWLLPGPIHTDLIIPMTPAARDTFDFLRDDGLPEGDWLILGWGAREFYTTVGTYADLEAGAVWSAVTGDSSVMRVLPIGPFTPQGDMTRLDLSDRQFAALLAAIRTGFAGDEPERLPGPGLGTRDVFYAGAGRFHLLRTCNVWVGEVLRAADIRVGLWTPFTWSLP